MAYQASTKYDSYTLQMVNKYMEVMDMHRILTVTEENRCMQAGDMYRKNGYSYRVVYTTDRYLILKAV